ncbi:MAG: Fe3+/spermidine/putrescine ABC transporter ATP-binding protein [Spirochaetes bacterium GWB1_66_5]|nr:MAG: Fe3+/spermidine/putrescine ABC transporter ATP-binding protein [Spirochaetes bacterium GWB1_66_5]
MASCEVRLQGIRKSFNHTEVLRDVSLTVESGEFVTILGPSGCGKTTLLRIVAGLELADQGRVILSGRDISELPANRRPVNTVFQSYALFPHLDVAENVAFGLKARRFPAEETRRRVQDALAMLHLEGFRRRHPHQLSGGERQRVALARALVNQPDVLLLDEPMSSLDAKLRSEVQLELRLLQRRLRKTFILVTHDQNEAMTVSDRIFVMREGRIVQSGSPAEVYDHPASRFVAEFLGTTNLIAASTENGVCRTPLGPLLPRVTPPWQEGVLAIRPERIKVRSDRPIANGLRAAVSELIYRGDHIDVFVQPGGLRLRCLTGVRLALGQRVWLELPAEHLEPLVE